MSKSKKGVQFIKNEEPSFIRQFKEKAGVKDSTDLQDKFSACLKPDQEDFEDRDDEKPQIVIPNDCNISKEDAQKIVDKQSSQETEEDKGDVLSKDGRLLFRKPTKRKSESSSNDKESAKKEKHSNPKMKASMLSFDAEEYDDEDDS